MVTKNKLEKLMTRTELKQQRSIYFKWRDGALAAVGVTGPASVPGKRPRLSERSQQADHRAWIESGDTTILRRFAKCGKITIPVRTIWNPGLILY